VARAYRSAVREDSSRRTRDAILAALAGLLEENGYAHSTVGEVARRAGVAVNTVYASVGGKDDLFLALLERGISARLIDEALDRIDAATSGAESLALVADAYRRSFESDGAVISALDEAARSGPAIAAGVDEARRVYRGRLDRVGRHLREIGTLAPGLTDDEVSDVLWFYFGFAAWPQLRAQGWKPGRIEAWLAARAGDALLGRSGAPG
jgi:AcrR family transcriptional regulator